ncbi:flagellar assembly peptidoglycan hydrolase FlgJ [Achromobacter xylosoxidans]
MTYTNGAAGRAGRQESVFDLGRLSDLKRDVKHDPDGTAQQKQVAKQFEALFLQMMLKRMREATPKEGLFDSQQSQMMQSMADEQLALHLATPGIGLSQAILGQMKQGKPGELSVPTPSSASARARIWTTPRAARARCRRCWACCATTAPATAPWRRRGRAGACGQLRVAHVARGQPAAQQSGVPARVILGQAALESGWGQREIKHPDGRTSHNLFGIKAGAGWKGQVVHVLTTEYEDGVAKKVTQPFRAYSSYEESFADYARLIGNSPRYETVAQARNEVEAARRIQNSGYATDPQYAQKLIGIMNQLRGAPRGASTQKPEGL